MERYRPARRAVLIMLGAVITVAGCSSSGAKPGPTTTRTHETTATVTATVTATAGVRPSTITRTVEDTQAQSTPNYAPVLGAPWASTQQGFGDVRPREINNGGDPTGLMQNITWTTWGGATASGLGTAAYEAPGQPVYKARPEPAKVRAFDLGHCNGRTAYLRVQWWFPQHGQSFDPGTGNGDAGYNICTGARA